MTATPHADDPTPETDARIKELQARSRALGGAVVKAWEVPFRNGKPLVPVVRRVWGDGLDAAVRGLRRHRPKALLDNLTLSAAKRRHFAAPTLENVGQSRSAASRACHVAPVPIRGHWRALHALLLRDLAVSLRPDNKVPVIEQDANTTRRGWSGSGGLRS